MMESKEEKDLHKNSEIIVKSIVYGSIAFWLGKKADETVSHKWVVYVRGLNNEDISYFIKEVAFTLHASFENHVRVVNKYPFELYEAGWGEFDIKITINFKDESIKPIEFVHPLKLYPQANISMSTKKPIVSENYEEIIFVNPKPHLRELLTNPSAYKKEQPIQIQMNIEDDKRSVDHSYLSQSDEKLNKSASEKQSRKEPINRLSANLENKFDKMNLGSQMENLAGGSLHGTNFYMQHKLDDMNQNNTQGNYKPSNTLPVYNDNMNVNPEMQVDYPTHNVNYPLDSESFVSNVMVR